jgi:hypothetical protein
MMNQMQMAGPMPGQAQGIQQVLPGMMPKQGAPTPQAMVGPLSQMHLQQLMQLMLNPRPEGPPLYAVLSAITEKQKQAQAQASMQRQMAMAQGQQAAQQPPVAQQVLAQAQQMQAEEPVMAAYGGEMQGYAGGGAVAFKDAGVVPPGLMNPDVDEDGLPRSKNEREQIIDYNNRIKAAYQQRAQAQARQAQLAQATAPKPAYPEEAKRRLEQFYQSTGREKAVPLGTPLSSIAAPAPAPVMSPEALTNRQGPSGNMAADRPRVAQPTATTFDITNPASINALRMAAQDTSLPEAERADLQRRIAMMEGNRPAQSGVASLAKPQVNLTPEEEQFYANRASTLRTRQGLPEDVLAGRQGIATLAAENLAAQRAEREQMAREAKEQRDAALAKAQRGIMDDPMALLSLAGSIDTRRGKGLGSLARGAAGLMGKREEQAEAARKEFALAQRDQRMLQANERQANMLEMQRQQAIRENDFTRVSQIEDQLAALEVQKSQLLRSRQEHAEKMTLEGLKVDAMKADAAAKLGRPTAIDFFRQDPEGYGRFMAAGRGPQTAGDRQDLNELKALQGNLQKQIENYVLPKAVRDAAAAQLQQVNAKLAQMAGLGNASTDATQLPPAALAQLKEGVVTKFANGQQWTLRNGQPTQVK